MISYSLTPGCGEEEKSGLEYTVSAETVIKRIQHAGQERDMTNNSK